MYFCLTLSKFIYRSVEQRIVKDPDSAICALNDIWISARLRFCVDIYIFVTLSDLIWGGRQFSPCTWDKHDSCVSAGEGKCPSKLNILSTKVFFKVPHFLKVSVHNLSLG